jgi:hypothetical protein
MRLEAQEDDQRGGSGGFDPVVGAVRVRLTAAMIKEMRTDLRRTHPFAAERIGFLSVSPGAGENGDLLVLGLEYHGVADEHYLDDPMVGARIGGDAIRGAMDQIRVSRRGMFHVHLHEHRGVPMFSPTDSREQPLLVQAFRVMNDAAPHGMLVLSEDKASAWIWMPGSSQPVRPKSISVVGYPLTRVHFDSSESIGVLQADRFERQSFLGANSQATLGQVRLGVVGLGGGGSHIVQQAAHIGFKHLRGFDGDIVEESNLNRLIGGWADDVESGTSKVEVASRLVRGVLADASEVMHPGRWQENPRLLRGCDVAIGCVDTFAERRELEMACRRYLIPYIDIGMDVHQVGDEPPHIGGQVILSMPGGPCMFCLGFLTEERLTREAALYGAAGGRPQVVWPNGVLASTAIGVAMDLVTGWTGLRDRLVYLSYNGNTGELTPHVRLRYLPNHCCPHYGDTDVGDPVFRTVNVSVPAAGVNRAS